MGDVNSVIIEGNLCRDVETKTTASGAFIASLSVAYNDSYKKGNEYVKQSYFFDVTAFNDAARGCETLPKGTLVHIEGKLVQDRWEKDGKTQSRVKIIAFKVEPMAGHGKGNTPSGQSAPNKPAPAKPAPPPDDGDVPF